jgi:thiol-disulfide isomerase/thioredoxin
LIANFLIVSLLWLAGPTLQPVDEAGYRAILAAHRGQVILINFWATWCDPCREELPQLAQLSGKVDRKKFLLVTISSDEPEQAGAALKLLREKRIPSPFYIKNSPNDGHFIDSIDSKWSGALPALFLYDRDGKLAHTFIGEVDMTEVEAAVRRLIL